MREVFLSVVVSGLVAAGIMPAQGQMADRAAVRRTLEAFAEFVQAKQNGRWVIAHLHTSGRRQRESGAVQSVSGDSIAVASTVERFHKALAEGDSLAALALLSDDLRILESGTAETRAEYRSGHLRADIGFASAVSSERGAIHVVVRGDVAWATSTSVTQGEVRGRTIDSRGAELMVLTREPTGWKIRAVHWSSRSRMPSRDESP